MGIRVIIPSRPITVRNNVSYISPPPWSNVDDPLSFAFIATLLSGGRGGVVFFGGDRYCSGRYITVGAEQGGSPTLLEGGTGYV